MRGFSPAPPQVISNAPRCVITGREEVILEQHTGLFSYETTRIRVRTAAGMWMVTGENLVIDFFGVRDLRIKGRIDGIEISGEERP